MKNKLNDLNNHLFAQMERLSDEGLSDDELEKEIKRSRAIVAVSDKIIRSANATLTALNLVAVHGDRFGKDLAMIEGPKTPNYSTETVE